MLERARSLEDARSNQLALASREFSNLARHGADAQREVISSVETVLKSTAYICASAGGTSRSCDLLRASLPANLPWIRSVSIVGKDGRVQCSTLNMLVGLNLSDRAYFKKGAGNPRLRVQRLSVRQIRSKDQASMIGHAPDTIPLLSAIAGKAISSDEPQGSLSFVAADGSKRGPSFARIAGTQSRLIVSIDEDRVSAAINREIRTAYLQLGFVCLFVLLGALIAAEKLIIRPIEMIASVAKRFGQGDWSVRAARKSLPAEFVQLARAFNAMAAQLGQRERELVRPMAG
jgi:HAMP domain-containing protein